MRKRLLASFLAVAMMLTMAPFAFAAEDTSSESDKVAKINNTEYDTLQDAIDAAQDGDTITLLKSGNGDGFVVKVGSFNDKGLTIDFNNFTYMIGGQLVGSATTGTNACQLNKDNKITLKNGSFIGATEGSKPADDTPNWHGAPAIMVQNYCDLTLENMVVTGGDETVYTVSNNCGNTVIKDSTVDAGKAKDYTSSPYAFDVCRFSSYGDVTVTVQGNSVINGDVEVSDSTPKGQTRQLNIEGGTFNGKFHVANEPANITITGGTFTTDVSDYLADGAVLEKDSSGNTWSVKNTVEVNGTGYTTLRAAIAAAKDGDTIKLLDDVTTNNIEDTVAARLIIDKAVTLDLNDKTITSPNDMGNNNTNFCALIIDADTTINATTGGINTGTNGGYAINIRNGATLTINGGEYYGGGTDVQVQKGTLIINDGDFSCEPYSNPVYGYKYLINCIDNNWKNGSAKIVINGGTFHNFDPSNSSSENPFGNFCAVGYVATKNNDDVYTVAKGAVTGEVENNEVSTTINGLPAVKDDTIDIEVAAPAAKKDNVTSSTVTIDKDTTAAIAEKDVPVTVKTDVGTLEISKEAFDEMNEGATANDANLVLNIADTTEANATKYVKQYEVTATANDQPVFSAQDNTSEVTVTVPYTANDGKAPIVYYVDGTNKTNMNATYDADKHTISWKTTHFSKFWLTEVSESQSVSIPYTVKAVAHESTNKDENGVSVGKFFNAGETITVDVIVDTTFENGKNVGAINAEIDYDSGKLSFEDATSTLSTNINSSDTGKVKLTWVRTNSAVATIGENGLTVATLQFKVKTGAASGETNFDVVDTKVTPPGYSINRLDPTNIKDTVQLCNIQIIFDAGVNAYFDENTVTTAHVGYNYPGFTDQFNMSTLKSALHANDSYRLAKDDTTERLWTDGTKTYTSDEVAQARFTENTTLTAIAIKQYKVTFVPANGVQGSVTSTPIQVDENGKVDASSVPTPLGNPGYTFTNWTQDDGTTAIDPATVTITKDTVFKANFTDASYTITFTPNDAATFTAITGVNKDGKATRGKDVTFALNKNPGYTITSVQYTVGTATPVNATVNGNTYTIPGEAITAPIIVNVVYSNAYTVKFVVEDGAQGTLNGTLAYTVTNGGTLGTAFNVTVQPNAGYEFDSWYDADGNAVTEQAIKDNTVTKDIMYTAKFKDASYKMTYPNQTEVTIKHGQNQQVDLDEVGETGKLVIGVNYSVNGATSEPLTADSNGNYYIPGDVITGNISITYDTIDGSLNFILDSNYKGLRASTVDGEEYDAIGAKIAKLTITGEGANGTKTYQMKSGGTFYWSEKYDAYVHIVSGWEENQGDTAATILAGMTFANAAAEKVSYVGDLNGDDRTRADDALIVNDVLNSERLVPTLELQRLMCDVNGDGVVDTKDVQYIIGNQN